MLHPPEEEDEQWIPQPGNPNFLMKIETRAKAKDVKKKKKKQKEEEDVVPLLKEQKQEFVSPLKKQKEEEFGPTPFEMPIAKKLYETLTPLYSFVGMLEAESGTTIYYRYLPNVSMEDRKLPINFGATSRDEFIARNPQLSRQLIDTLVPKEITSLIGANPNVDPPEYRPIWYWSMLGDPVFRFLLSGSTFGALQLAANEIGFPLKDLIYSNDVNYMFAQFVAKKFISPKSNAFVAGIMGGQTQYRISSGFNTSQMANTKWLIGCKEWFKGVYYAQNPVSLPELEAKIDEHTRELNVLAGVAGFDAKRKQVEAELERLKILQDTYSERVLKH